MAAPIYHVANQGQGTGVGTGWPVTTAPRTHIQIYAASAAIRVTEWGVSMNQTTAGTPVFCELLDTGTIGGTGVAYAANDITLFSDPKGNVPPLTLGTANAMYQASSEGTLTTPVRTGDVQQVAPTNQYIKQFPLGQEFVVPAGNYLRVRITGFAGATPNAYAYVNFSVG